MQALIFDSYYDAHRGVIAYVRIFSGEMYAGQHLYLLATQSKTICQEVGLLRPNMVSTDKLENGEVGYVVTGLKEIEKVKVGDTIADQNNPDLALPGYKEVPPKVFASIFPVDSDQYNKLGTAIAKLKLNDAALYYQAENIPALGFGFRCGFLGLLHMDIVQERLSREFDLDLVVTTPSVEYQVIPRQKKLEDLKTTDLQKIFNQKQEKWLEYLDLQMLKRLLTAN